MAGASTTFLVLALAVASCSMRVSSARTIVFSQQESASSVEELYDQSYEATTSWLPRFTVPLSWLVQQTRFQTDLDRPVAQHQQPTMTSLEDMLQYVRCQRLRQAMRDNWLSQLLAGPTGQRPGEETMPNVDALGTATSNSVATGLEVDAAADHMYYSYDDVLDTASTQTQADLQEQQADQQAWRLQQDLGQLMQDVEEVFTGLLSPMRGGASAAQQLPSTAGSQSQVAEGGEEDNLEVAEEAGAQEPLLSGLQAFLTAPWSAATQEQAFELAPDSTWVSPSQLQQVSSSSGCGQSSAQDAGDDTTMQAVQWVVEDADGQSSGGGGLLLVQPGVALSDVVDLVVGGALDMAQHLQLAAARQQQAAMLHALQSQLSDSADELPTQSSAKPVAEAGSWLTQVLQLPWLSSAAKAGIEEQASTDDAAAQALGLQQQGDADEVLVGEDGEVWVIPGLDQVDWQLVGSQGQVNWPLLQLYVLLACCGAMLAGLAHSFWALRRTMQWAAAQGCRPQPCEPLMLPILVEHEGRMQPGWVVLQGALAGKGKAEVEAWGKQGAAGVEDGKGVAALSSRDGLTVAGAAALQSTGSAVLQESLTVARAAQQEGQGPAAEQGHDGVVIAAEVAQAEASLH